MKYLLTILALSFSATASASFVYNGGPIGTFPDGGSLVFPKATNAAQPGIPANKQLYSDDVNALWQDELDLRAGIIGGDYHGLRVLTVAPAAPVSGVLIFNLNGTLSVEYTDGTILPILTLADKFFYDGGSGLVFTSATLVQAPALDAGSILAGSVQTTGNVTPVTAHTDFVGTASKPFAEFQGDFYVSTATSGNVSYSAVTGSHWHVGNGTNDYFSSDGSTVTFAGPVSVATGNLSSSAARVDQIMNTFGGYISSTASPQATPPWVTPSTGATIVYIGYYYTNNGTDGSGGTGMTWSVVDHTNSDSVLCSGTLTCANAGVPAGVISSCTAALPAGHQIQLGTNSNCGTGGVRPGIQWQIQAKF